MNRQQQILSDILGDPHAAFSPKMADKELSTRIFKDVRPIIRFYGGQLLHDAGWRFYGVKQTRGRCYYKSKVITIPAWVINKNDLPMKEWYIAHEMAHAYSYLDGHADGHGYHFMEMLKSICPSDVIHYELGYKPANAARAGIRSETQTILDSLF